MTSSHSPAPIRIPWKVTLVGPCAAGKSTLAARLRAAGVAARCVAQEHSHVPYLWQMSSPDVLVYLDLGLLTTQRRLHRPWSQSLFEEQRRRLTHARTHAHLILSTDDRTPEDLAAQVLQYLQTFDPTVRPPPPEPPLLRAFRSGHRDLGAT